MEDNTLFAPETKLESQPGLLPAVAPASAGDAASSSGERRRRWDRPLPDLSSSPYSSGDRRRREPKRDAMGGGLERLGRKGVRRGEFEPKAWAILEGTQVTATTTTLSGSLLMILFMTRGT